MHGFAIAKAPAPVKGGALDESAFARHRQAPRRRRVGETVSADLKPGKYELVCHVAGHYAAGQRSAFTVTGG